MNATSRNNRPVLSIDCIALTDIKAVLSDAQMAGEPGVEETIHSVSTLDQLSEIQAAVARQNHAKQNAYDKYCEIFFGINDFVQASQASGKRNVIHAYYSEKTGSTGEKTRCVNYYSREKSENLIVQVFDWMFYGAEKELAQKSLRAFLDMAPTLGETEFLENQQSEERSDKLSSKALIWLNPLRGRGPNGLGKDRLVNVRYSSLHFLKIANEIRQAKHHEMTIRITLEDEFFQWKPGNRSPNGDKANADIPRFPENFSQSDSEQEVRAFSDLVDDIKKQNLTGAENLPAISAFCNNWVNAFNRNDTQGDDFRNFINASSQLRAWNVVAHYVALRDDPYFIIKKSNPAFPSDDVDSRDRYAFALNPAVMDLRRYGDKVHVMLPPLEEIYLPQRTTDEQAAFLAVRAADRKLRGEHQFVEINDQVIAPYKRLDISAECKSLTAAQESEIISVYQEFIGKALEAGHKIVLTPLFNYTEYTIDRCMDAIIISILTQQIKQETLPEIRFFSADPRITDKYDRAMKNPAEYMALRTTSAVNQADLAIAASHGIDRMQLQYGIRSDDMKSPGMIMMHAPAGKYGAEDKEAALALEGFTKKPVFAKAASEGKAVPRARKKATKAGVSIKPGLSEANNEPEAGTDSMRAQGPAPATQFIMPTHELKLASPSTALLSNLLWEETLDSEQLDDIRLSYARVFENAEKHGISKLMLIPCFDLGAQGSLREQACAAMLGVLDQLLSSHPRISVTMAVASQQDLAFLKQQTLGWKKAGLKKQAQKH